MATDRFAAIVLAAGMGTRMRSSLPKALHPLAGQPMVKHLLDTVETLCPERVVVVIGPDMDRVAKAVAPHPVAVQAERLGTGHAVAQAGDALRDFDGTILVLYADTPLITRETIESLLERRRAAPEPAVVVLGFRPDNPAEYGRLVTAGGDLEAIVEFKEATPAQRAIALCNAGVMAIDGKRLFDLVGRLSNKNAKSEYYLTDIVALARAGGLPCAAVEGRTDELLGVNSRQELATAERVVQDRLRRRAMEGGATLIDPPSTFFSWDTRLGQDVTVGPCVVFGPGVAVGNNVEIRAFSHIEGADIADGAQIGPYARLRPGARIGRDAHIGNFVEVKQATIEEGAKANHLTYIGDARVGAGSNIGAGTITCNYDGFNKSFTDIGAGVFIGSDTALVAPVKVGDGAVIGAGSVITRDVAPGALAVARGDQVDKPGGGERLREKKRAAKAAMMKG